MLAIFFPRNSLVLLVLYVHEFDCILLENITKPVEYYGLFAFSYKELHGTLMIDRTSWKELEKHTSFQVFSLCDNSVIYRPVHVTGVFGTRHYCSWSVMFG
jgi:hypothetical protein